MRPCAGPLIRAVRTQLTATGRRDLLHRATLEARAAAATGDAATLLTLCETYGVAVSDVGLAPATSAEP